MEHNRPPDLLDILKSRRRRPPCDSDSGAAAPELRERDSGAAAAPELRERDSGAPAAAAVAPEFLRELDSDFGSPPGEFKESAGGAGASALVAVGGSSSADSISGIGSRKRDIRKRKRIAWTDPHTGKRVRKEFRDGREPASKYEVLATARAKKVAKSKEVITHIVHTCADRLSSTQQQSARPSRKQMRDFRSVQRDLRRMRKAPMLRCKVKTKRGHITYQQSSAEDVVDLACTQSPCINSIAREFRTSRSTTLRYIRSTALAFVAADEVQLMQSTDDIISDPPDWSVIVPMSDSTTMVLGMYVDGVRVKVPWHLMVYDFEAVWGHYGRVVVNHVKPTIPPIPVLGTTASNTYDALESHSFTRPIAKFRETLLAATKSVPFVFKCDDDASSNRKKHAHELDCPDGHGGWQERIPCMNHQNFIGQFSVKQAASGLKSLHKQHSTASFLNAGNHRLRCSIATGGWVDQGLKIFHGTQSPEEKQKNTTTGKQTTHKQQNKTKPTNNKANKKTNIKKQKTQTETKTNKLSRQRMKLTATSSSHICCSGIPQPMLKERKSLLRAKVSSANVFARC